MTRPLKPSGSRRDSHPSLVRIDHTALRDHGDGARIERIWARIDQQLELAPSEAAAAKTSSIWLSRAMLLAAGAAAGFGLGVAASVMLGAPAGTPQPVVVAPSLDRSGGTRVFAAGTAARGYALPGGGHLQVAPDSIVDTVSKDDAGLTLRLVRGSATVMGAGGSDGPGRITLRIGDAQIKSIRGTLRVSLTGHNANVAVLNGSAAVVSPHLDGGKTRTLQRFQQATLPTRAITAATRPALASPSLAEPALAEPPAPAADTPPDPGTAIAPSSPTAPAPWQLACDGADYAKAVALLENKASGAQQLTCLATGLLVLQDRAGATTSFQSVIRDFPTSPYASTAAHYLAGLYGAANNTQQAEHYRQMAARLSKGALLSAQALCQKIEKVAATNDAERLTALSDRYKKQYPDGPCINTIDHLLAALAARQQAPAPDAGANTDGGEAGPPNHEPTPQAPPPPQQPPTPASAAPQAPAAPHQPPPPAAPPAD